MGGAAWRAPVHGIAKSQTGQATNITHKGSQTPSKLKCSPGGSPAQFTLPFSVSEVFLNPDTELLLAGSPDTSCLPN